VVHNQPVADRRVATVSSTDHGSVLEKAAYCEKGECAATAEGELIFSLSKTL
jgi:hypothetical protein